MRIPPPRDVERRVLDIGCGNGRYLCWLREIGWECYGNETDPRAVAVARKAGLSVFHGDLADANYADEFFDVVNVSSVLDHTADPMGNVRHAYRVLRRGGWIVAHSPNFDGLQSWFFGTRWIDFIPPEHLYFFTPRTFRSVFERAGFVVERIWTASPTNSLSHTLMYRTWARPLFLYARDHWGLEPEWWPLVKLAFWPAARMQDVLGRGEAVYLRARKPAGGGSREDPATV
jgi:SAM-dependent methyltransferase